MRIPALSLPLPVRERLDEFVAMPERKRVKVAVAIAVGFHLLIILFSGVWTGFFPTPKREPQEKKTLSLVIQEPEKTPVAEAHPQTLTPQEEAQLEERFLQLPPELQQRYIDVDGLAKTKNMSKAALFYSWEDSVAASEIEGEGDSPLPSQEGRADLSFTQFKTQKAGFSNAGKMEPSVKETLEKKAEMVVTPPPPKKAEPSKPVLLAKADIAPAGMEKVITANEDQIALYLAPPPEQMIEPAVQNEPPPPPDPAPEEKPELPKLLKTPPAPRPEPVREEPKKDPPPEPVKPEPVKPSPPEPKHEDQFAMVATKTPSTNNSGQAIEMEQTKVKGGKMKRGKKGVDAVATVAGRYKKNVYMAVGSRWNYYIKERGSLIQAGQVQIVITLDSQGKVRKFSIKENSSNDAHAAVIEQCIREAEFDPPPPELLKDGVFEYDLSFNLY